MKIILPAISPSLIDAWKEFFNAEEHVTIVEGDITTIECNAVVSPANSFGFMDGGLDYALSVRFGWDLRKNYNN
jgi:O-acetyl-ADP-ribose deacetylase (regulator of RNase III)